MTAGRWTAVPLAALTVFLAFVAVRSMEWRMVHDPPLNLYQGFLMDRLGLVPYRDFWDNNPPGSQLLHALVGRVFGYDDVALRRADLLLVGVTAGATAIALWPLGARVAWCGAVVWALVYLGRGPSFQRDDFVILACALASAVTHPATHWPARLRAALCGLLFGAAATIKPPALVGLPILLASLACADGPARAPSRTSVGRRMLGALCWAALGASLPFLGVTLYLWRNEALEPFLDMARGYWPLYTRLSGGLGTIQSPLFNLYSGYRNFGRLEWWLLPAGAGLFTALRATRSDPGRRRIVLMLAGLAVAFLAYVGIQGKFFPYHWQPFLYCLVALSALALAELNGGVPSLLRPLPPLLLLGFLFQHLPLAKDFREQLQGRPPAAPKGGRVDEIARFLEANLRPEDTVQPLDWTGGVVHGMLIAGARPATPYLYDFPFYHHVSHPYVFELRGRFLEALRRARPRFVIEVPGEDKPWVRGKETTRDFNKLRRFLEGDYSELVRGDGYVVYERRTRP